MSFAAPVAPGDNRRPTTVTAAGYLQYLVAVLLVIIALLPLASIGKVADAFRQAYANSTTPTPDSVATGYEVAAVGGAIITIILAIALAILARFTMRGRQGARITTWVLAGLSVLCTCGGATGALGSRLTTNTSSSGVSTATVNDLVDKARPSWLVPTTSTLSVIGLLGAIAVIILLALPASNPYFRRAAPGTPGGGPDPAYPNLSYPPVPGAESGNQPGGYPPNQPGGTPPADQPPAPPAA